MKKIEVAELKRIQLDILIEVDKYCRGNDINYSLAYGTLIGAVRHKGYIPWDDDIDIMMPRKDYELFLSGFNSYKPYLGVVSPYSDRKYYAPYTNVFDKRTMLHEEVYQGVDIGVKIDVFPIDRVPDSKKEQIKLYNKVRRITRFLNIMTSKGEGESNTKKSKLFYILSSLFLPFVSYSRLLNKIAVFTNNRNKNSNYVNNIVWCAAKEKGCFNKHDMDRYIEIEFEGYSFKALVGYDDFLRAHYGDYMILPPIEKRKTHHTFQAYWR